MSSWRGGYGILLRDAYKAGYGHWTLLFVFLIGSQSCHVISYLCATPVMGHRNGWYDRTCLWMQITTPSEPQLLDPKNETQRHVIKRLVLKKKKKSPNKLIQLKYIMVCINRSGSSDTLSCCVHNMSLTTSGTVCWRTSWFISQMTSCIVGNSSAYVGFQLQCFRENLCSLFSKGSGRFKMHPVAVLDRPICLNIMAESLSQSVTQDFWIRRPI